MASEASKQIIELVKQWSDQASLSTEKFDLQALRTAMSTTKIPVPEDAKFEKIGIGGIPAEWVLDPDAQHDRRMVYFHGGFYVAGSLDMYHPLSARISKASGCAVLLVDYRLAPENPFPAAVDDALTSFRWMRQNGPNGQAPANKTFIAGDSAGGGLTLATIMRLRDEGEELPDAAVTISALTDIALTGESIKSRSEVDPMIRNTDLLPDIYNLYLSGTDPKTPMASPLYGDFSGFPSLLIQVGDYEVLLNDSTRLADKAKSAGVDVKLEVEPEMFHDFQHFAPLFPEAQQAIDRIGEFVRSF
jgi:acetyl esterase/lipase